ncbi:MAG: YitT family protein [Anaerovoracaceae bacterium]|nr:YitT family protein [Bacillota bacterium]MDY2671007.1 YitT family protein [Anaerovoracaceae bacterium]
MSGKRKEKIRPYKFLLFTLAGMISSLGITVFLQPVGLYDSGIAGTSMLLAGVTPSFLTLPVFLLILNIPLILYGLKEEGPVFTVYAIYAVTVFAVATHFFGEHFHSEAIGSSPIVGNEVFLCCIFGGLICGIGSGLAIRNGGAIDGVEVLSVVISNKTGIAVSSLLMIYNVILFIACGFVIHNWILPLYSMVAYEVSLKTIDFISDGIDRSRSVLIVTGKGDEVAAALSEEFAHGITTMDARGWYSGANKTMIYIIVNRFQMIKLKDIVIEIDPKAYITVSEVSDVIKAV